MLNSTQGPKVRQLGKEKNADIYLPYTRHVTEKIIALRSRAVMTTIKLAGISFETKDTQDLNILHRQLNQLWRNVNNEQLSVWTHMVRRRDRTYPSGEFWTDFTKDLDAKYRDKMVNEELYRNEWFITLIWSPENDPTRQLGQLIRKLSKARKKGIEVEEKSIRQLEDVTRTVVASLKEYEPAVLSTYEKNGLWFSQPTEFLHLIGTLEDIPMPLIDGPLGGAIYTDRVLIGRETIEIRSSDRSRLAGIFGIKEYPSYTKPGQLNDLLSAPFECVMAQSFSMKSKTDAKTAMSLKQGQMVNANDRAFSQIDDLDQGIDDLESNRFTMGEHHFNLMVLSSEGSKDDLLDKLSHAKRILAEAGMVSAREDLALESAYWSFV